MKKAAKKAKVAVVMHEFKRGTLHSGSGAVVKNPKQAVAIAMSEAGVAKRKPRPMDAAKKWSKRQMAKNKAATAFWSKK